MSYTTEQPSSFDFEECCICNEEFSDETELASHLLEHAEESIYNATNEDSSTDGDYNGIPVTPTKETYPEYTTSNLVKPQELNSNFTKRSESPEVWEINSDEDSGGEQTPLQTRSQPELPRREIQQRNRRPVGRPLAQNVQRQQNVIRHSQMHPPFTCSTCTSVFMDPKMFRDHILTHEKPRPYACNICNKTFAYKGTLRQHLRLHIGEQLHECAQCQKRFTIKAVLKKHCEDVHAIFT